MINLNKKGFIVALSILLLLSLFLFLITLEILPDRFVEIIYFIILPIMPPVNFLTALIVALLLAQWKKDPEYASKRKYPFYLILLIVVLPYLIIVLASSMVYNG